MVNRVEIERRKQDILGKLRHTSRSGNKVNCFQAYMSETEEHIRKKFEVWLKLRSQGYDVWCEPIFKSGIRMDILAHRDGIFVNYEILHTETKEKFLSKCKNYPEEITIIPIKSKEDIENLELF